MKNQLVSLLTNNGLLAEKGDKLTAFIGKNGAKVVKIAKNNGNNKYSATLYPSGKLVQTVVTNIFKD